MAREPSGINLGLPNLPLPSDDPELWRELNYIYNALHMLGSTVTNGGTTLNNGQENLFIQEALPQLPAEYPALLIRTNQFLDPTIVEPWITDGSTS